jgi:hypothetical protein
MVVALVAIEPARLAGRDRAFADHRVERGREVRFDL